MICPIPSNDNSALRGAFNIWRMKMSQQTEALLYDAGKVLRDLFAWAEMLGGWESEVWERAEITMLKIEAMGLCPVTKEN